MGTNKCIQRLFNSNYQEIFIINLNEDDMQGMLEIMTYLAKCTHIMFYAVNSLAHELVC